MSLVIELLRSLRNGCRVTDAERAALDRAIASLEREKSERKPRWALPRRNHE